MKCRTAGVRELNASQLINFDDRHESHPAMRRLKPYARERTLKVNRRSHRSRG